MADLYEDEVKVLEGSEVTDPETEAKTIANHIATIVSELDTQERTTRDHMLRLWKYLELLWCGAGNYYWDHSSNQWRAVTQEDLASLASEADVDPALLNKTVNLIRPYGESLAGVLTTGLPRVRYYPADADNDLDIQASKGYTDVEKKINDDNMMPLRLIEILVKLWNGGFAAAYNYTHFDKKYGTYKEPVLGNRDFNQQVAICAECGNEQILSESEVVDEEQAPEISNVEEDSAPEQDISAEEMQDPDPEIQAPPEMPELQPAFCESCQADVPHITTNLVTSKEVQIDENELPKHREIIQIFGPMNVKISSLAVRKEHIFWLILEEDIDIALAKDTYRDYRDKISPTTSGLLDVDRLARVQYEIQEDSLKNAATIRKVWLKPAAFEKLDTVNADLLRSKYPNGLMAVFCGDTYLEAEESNLDDHWTISINPLYNRVHADPLGKAIIGCHESANDLFQLEIDTVRNAVPITFADPKHFDFKAFGETRTLPGSVTPLSRPAGGKLQDVIASTTTSTLPQGIEYLDNKVEKLIQFISGVLPSVFGGPATGSKTLGEYQESKNQALQRLSIIWKIVCVMYAEMMAKSTKQYVDNLRTDEKFVRPNGRDGYMNVWIRRETFSDGQIGEVKPELSDQFPMTWAQIQARVMELFGLNNDMIMSWFLHPENVELVYKVIGIDDLYVPGEDQRNKQLYEIGEILKQSQPIANPLVPEQMMQPPQFVYPTEPVDNHQLHMEVLAAYLNSPLGIDLKLTNPAAYMNLTQHYQMHAGQFELQQAAMQEEAEANTEKSGKDKSEPVSETNA